MVDYQDLDVTAQNAANSLVRYSTHSQISGPEHHCMAQLGIKRFSASLSGIRDIASM